MNERSRTESKMDTDSSPDRSGAYSLIHESKRLKDGLRRRLGEREEGKKEYGFSTGLFIHVFMELGEFCHSSEPGPADINLSTLQVCGGHLQLCSLIALVCLLPYACLSH